MIDDGELLSRFATTGDESAFRELVARHLDLVYSAALRQLNGDRHLAEDVAQTVFADLTRKARSLNKKVVLSGWLYEAARFAATKAVRGEQRRRAREQEVLTMHDPTPDAPPAWEQLCPVLDQAMGELNATDRNAVLLRFFDRKDLGAVGRVLGISEDAAQKRVGRALEKLRFKLVRHGVTLSAPAVAAAITGGAVQSAPAALAVSVGTTALTSAASAGTGVALTTLSIMAMTKVKLGIVGAIVVAGVATPLVMQQQRVTRLMAEREALIQQANQAVALAANNQRLSNLLHQAAGARSDSNQSSELLKLRAEVARLRNDAQELARLRAAQKNRTNDTTEGTVKSWLARVEQLKQRLEATPGASIPEFQLLTEQDWLKAAKGELNSDDDYRRAFSALRGTAEGKFAQMLHTALGKYVKNNNKQLPTDLAQLQSYFDSPADPAILERWEIAPASTVQSLDLGGDLIITQKDAVDDTYDTRYGIGPGGWGGSDFLLSKSGETMAPVFEAFQKANNGQYPDELALLRPYAATPEQKLALEKMIQKKTAGK